jgi:hypothetical protein
MRSPSADVAAGVNVTLEAVERVLKLRKEAEPDNARRKR